MEEGLIGTYTERSADDRNESRESSGRKAESYCPTGPSEPEEEAKENRRAESADTGTEERDSRPILDDVRFFFPQAEVDIRTYSPLALAFLGDAVYSLVIRTIVVGKGNRQAEKLHNETKNLVSAHAQAAVADAIGDLLTEEEARVYKRGRNSNPYHHAKNATLSDYLKATGLESLCGYLYLKGELPRFLLLLREGIARAQIMN